MKENNLRYSGPPSVRQSYMTEFVVHCPKCKGEAFVTVEDSYFQNNGKLICKNCMHSETANQLLRYNLIVKRNCDNCGKLIEIVIPNQKEKVDEIALSCPHCEITRTYQPRNEEYIKGYSSPESKNDPIFNLPLWFQTDIRGNLFWAYNREHLNEIKTYIKSKLRERQTTTHMTMVERLPNFIKYAKNRKFLIKMIEKVERKSKI